MESSSTERPRRAGRPKGSKSKRRPRPTPSPSPSPNVSATEAPTSDLTNVIEQSKAAIAEETGAPASESPPSEISPVLGESSALSPTPEMASMAPLIARGLEVPFKSAAARTGFDGFNLTSEEADREARNIEQMLLHFMPKLAETDPKLLVVLTAAGSLGLTVMGKYMAYQAWLEEKKKREKPKESEPKESAAPVKPIFSVPAESYFKE